MTPGRLRRGGARRARAHRARDRRPAGRGDRPPGAASAPSRRCAAPSGAASASARPTTEPLRVQEAGSIDEIAIPLYDRFTALDAVGPYEVLSRIPGAEVTWLGARGRARSATDTGMLAHRRRRRLRGPARPGHRARARRHGHATTLLDDERLVGWIRRAHETSQWTTSVCTGSLLLGAAGVLDGLEATTPLARPRRRSSASARSPTGRRVVEQGKVITAAGVSSGIDMAPRARRADRRPRGRAGDPARHRVRPAAAVRRRLGRQGAAGDRGAGARGGGGRAELAAPVARPAPRASMPGHASRSASRRCSPHAPPRSPAQPPPPARRDRRQGLQRRRLPQLRHHLRDEDQRQRHELPRRQEPDPRLPRLPARQVRQLPPRVKGYNCSERRFDRISTQYGSRVTCRRGDRDGEAHLSAVHLGLAEVPPHGLEQHARRPARRPRRFRWMPSASRTMRRRPSTVIASR